METFGDLIDRFGGAEKMGEAISQSPATIRQWRARNSVPARFWQTIIDAAKALNIKGINASSLTALASCRKAA